MALDGLYISMVVKEMQDILIGARVEKVSQPSKEQLVISLRYKSEKGAGSRKIFLNANASSPRIHLTNVTLENPQSPPMFCMLMRKHLNSGRLVAINQQGFDRVVSLEFEVVNELGDMETVRLVIEIMGRHSNIILVNQNGKIIDCIKRVTHEVSSVRALLPGMTYEPAPSQDKLNLSNETAIDIVEKVLSQPKEDIAKAIVGTVEGISPLVAREVTFKAFKGNDVQKSTISNFYKQRLEEQIAELQLDIENNRYVYSTVKATNLKLNEFSFIALEQYGGLIDKKEFESPSELLDTFYQNDDQQLRVKQKAGDLLKLIVNTTERIAKKLEIQKKELIEHENCEHLKIKGDLLNANLYSLNKGDTVAKLYNFYQDNELIEIELDVRLNPQQNAQKYYNEYKKSITAQRMLKELMENSEIELTYLDSVFDIVTRTTGDSELFEIKEELMQQGYLKYVRGKKKNPKALPPLKYKTTDGYEILCGRNNRQNDQLTLKTAGNYDMWLHTQGIAGSHVIIKSNGGEFSDDAITQGATIAAYHSKAQTSSQVPVDYTLVRYVKKPNGAKPGMVIFTDFYTAYVTPDKELVDSLMIK